MDSLEPHSEKCPGSLQAAPPEVVVQCVPIQVVLNLNWTANLTELCLENLVNVTLSSGVAGVPSGFFSTEN